MKNATSANSNTSSGATEKKLKRRRLVSNIIIIASVAVLAVALIMIFRISSEDQASKNVYEDLRMYTVTPSDGQEVSGTLDRVIDFDALQSMNPDIIGWILAPEAGVDYPILRGTEDNFYISHSADRTSNRAGSIFLDNQNNVDFSDPNTIIYGHRMNNGSMFGSLRNYEEEAFFNTNRYIAIYTPENGKQLYEVFATYTVPDDADTYTLFSQGGPEFMEYLNQMKSYSDFPSNIELSENDKIITLSTCVQYEDDKRYIVQAVQVDPQEVATSTV